MLQVSQVKTHDEGLQSSLQYKEYDIWGASRPFEPGRSSEKRQRRDLPKEESTTGFSHCSSVNTPPLKLQNRFEELYVHNTSESVATGSTNVSTIEGASSLQKCSAVKQTACLIPCFRNLSHASLVVTTCIVYILESLVVTPQLYSLRVFPSQYKLIPFLIVSIWEHLSLWL